MYIGKVTVSITFIYHLSIQSRLIHVMELLSCQSWLLAAALILATLLVVRFQSWGAVEHTSRQRQELEVLYEPTDVDNRLSSSGRRSKHAVECVFSASQFFVGMGM